MSKKLKRNENNIGKDNFEFDYEKEKNKYCYLWGIKTYKKGIRKLADNEKFEYYSEWSQYIIGKYNGYSLEMLNEFSRYLGQRVKNLKPYIEAWNIMIPIMITLLITVIFNLLVDITTTEPETKIALTVSSFFCLVIGFVIIFVIVFVIYFKLLLDVTTPLWDNNTEENLLTDYKEVIDNLIKDKAKNKKKEKDGKIKK